jgi:pyruvate ferredoxin oxidoreductase gamma subunit
MLSVAAFTDGKYAQAFPAFGAERTGAPVLAFVRLGDKPIRVRSQVYHPDVVVVQDPTLIKVVNVLQGLKPGGMLLINTAADIESLGLTTDVEVMVVSVPATDIALEVIGRPTPNTTMLGAFAGATGDVSLEAMQAAVRHRFGGLVGESNAKAVQRAYEFVKDDGKAKFVLQPAKPAAKAESTGSAPTFTIGWPGQPGTANAYRTGDWRTFRPIFKQVACTGCTLCAVYCPESCITALEKKKYDCDYYYCKGCGICADACPVNDIEMVKEEGA